MVDGRPSSPVFAFSSSPRLVEKANTPNSYSVDLVGLKV
ncbi:hypothetical protein JOE69_002544 [Arthrobacter russicus]|uniref:Uncharacterized protein n=1 Tax=Arthrobacter russicus TaxID=172040 RepID=A0ABU1JFY2_9MICC|nr:hypothetical protein [Arthrobacter russicus]